MKKQEVLGQGLFSGVKGVLGKKERQFARGGKSVKCGDRNSFQFTKREKSSLDDRIRNNRPSIRTEGG